MSVTVTDPGLLAQLAVGDSIELRDPSGRVLGVFTPEGLGRLPPGVQSPFTDEEMARRRQGPKTGRPLKDILRGLEGRG
jgi:hypothetical protein